MHRQSLTVHRHPARPVIVDLFLTLWASLPFEDPRLRWFLPVLLGNGNLGRRVAPLQYAKS